MADERIPPELPRWEAEGQGGLGGYLQGVVCYECGRRFGLVAVTSIGTEHQHVAWAICASCAPASFKAGEQKVADNKRLLDQNREIQRWLGDKPPAS